MPAARQPASRAARRTAGSPTRPPLTAQEAQALRALLAARAAAAGRAAGTASRAPGAVTTSTRPTPTAGRPATSGRPTGARRAASPRGKTVPRGRPDRGRAARGRPARGRANRPGAWRRLLGAQDAGQWKRRLTVVVLGVLLPALAGLLVPTRPAPAGAVAATDPAGLAVAAQSTLLEDAARYRRLEQDVGDRRADLAAAQAAEEAARAQLAADRDTVGRAAADLYRASAEERVPLLRLDVGNPGSTGDVLYLQLLAERAGEALATDVVQARRAEQAVAAAAARTTAARAAVDTAVRESAALLAAVRRGVAELAPATAAQLSGLAAAAAAGEQRDRNEQALRRWQEYLGGLAAAGIDPPAAAELAAPATLPPGFSPALDGEGRPVPGIAWAVAGNRPVTVLPAETVAAVSVALSQLGRPYVAGGAGPEAYDCGGLVHAAWLQAGFALPAAAADQWRTGAAVPASQLQVGDLVFADGGGDVGLYLGEGQVLGASAAGYQVGVRTLTETAGAVRVTLGFPAEPNPALPASASGRGACGAPPAPVGPVSPAWGGWGNGRIPASVLCAIGPGHALRCDAAAGYTAMAEAFADAFGRPLCITDSYRSLAAQVTAFRTKPRLAAVPGTSNHGWGLAVDLCGGVNIAGSAQWTWMTANAGRFGFVQPDWAGPTGEKPEPWHWEYGHLG